MKMHPLEQFIHNAKHAPIVTHAERAPRVVKEKADPKTEQRAKRARLALLKGIAEHLRLENTLDKAGMDLVIRHGHIESRYDAAV